MQPDDLDIVNDYLIVEQFTSNRASYLLATQVNIKCFISSINFWYTL